MLSTQVRSARYLRVRELSTLTHIDSDGARPKMVDVGSKKITTRTATARSLVRMPPTVFAELKRMSSSESGKIDHLVGPKGAIGTTAIIAGVLGAKHTSSLIPFCHPLPLNDVQIDVSENELDSVISIECTVRVTHKTGVEMEALMGASIAALTVYDMCKALSHDIVIERTELVSKTGGKRDFTRI